MRVYNFAAGPSTLPEDVLKEAQRDMLDFNGTGMSITEMSHRSKAFMAVNEEANSLLRELMNIPDEYAVLFVQGGASQQFAAVPLNLMTSGKADYIVTGNFAKKAWEEGLKYGEANVIASSADKNFTYIPDVKTLNYTKGASYLHITANNTIFGTRYREFPTPEAPLAADMSSNILSEEIDVKKFGLIYAGAQKNIAPAGVTIVIVRKDLLGKQSPVCPTMLCYETQAKNDSLYNTPPCFCIYMAMLTFRHLKKLGGVKAVQQVNEYKAKLLYDFIDNSAFYTNSVQEKYRSLMNVPFVTRDAETDAKFVKEATAAGLVSLKGHRLVGGMRASIYNAMPVEGVKALIAFMKKFELENA
ncbi:MAG: 3-phosphoserine/phosphohydroxythreonine transaminase [Candidatus Borkfalkiaceae bacterium]|nr:3-phosphoserine/phosphohydroxythreonine transaminase [Christensenellaceae bacterium]